MKVDETWFEGVEPDFTAELTPAARLAFADLAPTDEQRMIAWRRVYGAGIGRGTGAGGGAHLSIEEVTQNQKRACKAYADKTWPVYLTIPDWSPMKFAGAVPSWYDELADRRWHEERKNGFLPLAR